MKRRMMALAAGLICCITILCAQPKPGTFSIMPKAGVNLTTLTGEPTMMVSVATFQYSEYYDYGAITPYISDVSVSTTAFTYHSMRFGWNAGIQLGYQLSNRWALAGEVQYSLQGAKYDDVSGYGLLYSINNITLNMHYLNIPLMAKFYPVRGLAIEAGLQPEYCFSRKLKCDIEAGTSTIRSKDGVSGMADFGLSVPVGVSYEMGNVVVDARYNIGISNIYSGSWDGGSKPSSRNSVFQLTVGYKFDM